MLNLGLLTDDQSINFGAIYENFVAQELKAHGFSLYYYNNKRLGELDFVVEYKGNVLPIEVKSGKDYERHNALTNVMGIKDYGIPSALVLCNDNISQKDNITYMPIYMIMFLKKDKEVNVTYKFDLTGIKL